MKEDINFNKPKKDTRIVVAMSGGVDSSVVACLLKEQGYDVIGITLQLFDYGEATKKSNTCCAGADIYDAKKIAQKFDFPHYVLNYENLFKDAVIDNFADTYLQGETPIPCIECNKSVKFRDLFKVAKDLNADALATGHYVQRKVSASGEVEMHKAIDHSKDQSYFLFSTTKEQLDFLIFPLGGDTKEFTRQEAKRLGLEIADKPDSQDICFVPNGDYGEVIRKYKPSAFKKGDFIHYKTKEKLGEHDGIINFTLGQRKGLGISFAHPLYVVKIEPKENIVYVGEEDLLQNNKFKIRDLNWIATDINTENEIKAKVRLRSNSKEEDAIVKVLPNNMASITMLAPTRAITPGQACVIYNDDSRVLGGGYITKEII